MSTLGGKLTLCGRDLSSQHVHMRAICRASIALALISTACSRSAEPPQFDICAALKNAPELIGKRISLVGWFGNVGFATRAMGSGACPEKLIEPMFDKNVIIQFQNEGEPDADRLRSDLSNNVSAPDFYAHFVGRLRKRTGQVQSGPVPMDGQPNLDDMPYVFDIERVTDARFERATFVPEPPPEPR